MAKSDRTKTEPLSNQVDATGDSLMQSPSPLDGVQLPRAPKGHKFNLKHGLTYLQRAMKNPRTRVIDMRTRTGKALAQWRVGLIADLGGQDNVSVQQATLVNLCVKSKLLLDSIDTWLLNQNTLVNPRKKALLPVVTQRQQLADGLAKYLSMLGLERRVRVRTLQEILAQDDGKENKP